MRSDASSPEATGTPLTIGERVAWHRKRRGIPQEVLADQVGRTVDWLSKVENNRIDCDRLSVINSLAEALRVPSRDLIDPIPAQRTTSATVPKHVVPGLREALLSYAAPPTQEGPPDLDRLELEVRRMWEAYQSATFGLVTARAPFAVRDGHRAIGGYNGDNKLRAQRLLALAYQVAGLTLTKVGDTELSLLASDRGLSLAHATGDPVVIGSLYRSMTHSLLANGDYATAVRLTREAGGRLQGELRRPSPTLLSVYGAMYLAGALAAARAQDRATTQGMLSEAADCAARLGSDSNHLWTCFGPTNVAIHRVSAAMELGDVQTGLSQGPRVVIDHLPAERKVRHTLEVARAHSSSNKHDDALGLVLDAERMAPEQVRTHFLSRRLVTELVRRQRSKPSHRLAGLAQRIGVA